MLSITFKGHPKANAIILEKPIHVAMSGNGVTGIIECAICSCRAGLFHADEYQLADEVEQFIKNHKYLLLSRRSEVKAFAEKLQRGLPNAVVRIKKGNKDIPFEDIPFD